jgi:cytochrome c-type biogenesis protein CcmH
MAILLVGAIFAVLAMLAAAFVFWPVLREKALPGSRKMLLAVAIACAVIGIGAGSYLMIGRPDFAVRSFEPPERQTIGGLIAILVKRVHQHPDDTASWIWLGRAYETAFDPDDAAKSFARAVAIAQSHRALAPDLLSAYGEALVRSAGGTVTPEAESAFKAVYAANPRNVEAQYFLGFAAADRGQDKVAIALWQGALADLPQNSPLAHDLKDRLAQLLARSGKAPDVHAMVASLAQQLERNPDDAEGWRRLIRAWMVLGEHDKAQDALKHARSSLHGQPEALAAIDAEARELKLQ